MEPASSPSAPPRTGLLRYHLLGRAGAALAAVALAWLLWALDRLAGIDVLARHGRPSGFRPYYGYLAGGLPLLVVPGVARWLRRLGRLAAAGVPVAGEVVSSGRFGWLGLAAVRYSYRWQGKLYFASVWLWSALPGRFEPRRPLPLLVDPARPGQSLPEELVRPPGPAA